MRIDKEETEERTRISDYDDYCNQSGLGINYGCEVGPCEECDNVGCHHHPDN